MELAKDEFSQQITNAYQHLYDLVYLRSHALTDLLIPDPTMQRKRKAWLLHDILLNVLEELDPGSHAPVFSREWRRYRLLTLRYTDGLDPQAVANELAISRRHFYREHDAALEAIASILWDRYVQRPNQIVWSQPVETTTANDERLSLLREEAARLNQSDGQSLLPDVVARTVDTISEMTKHKAVQIEIALREPATRIGMDRTILRQILLGLLSYQIDQLMHGVIRIVEAWRNGHINLTLESQGDRVAEHNGSTQVEMQLSMLDELAAMQKATINATINDAGLHTFTLILPGELPRSVLVVDDNEDVLELFRRYLQAHHYQIMPTQSSTEALQLALECHPYAVILDLMLPERDGWDVLQTLVNQPNTQHIPIVICTVLGAKSLAFALGATAFLEKPVTEHKLVETLQGLGAER
ncbi:MAG TPA: response regulator [Caldilineaceae bacterium]|nr:response regulator [Caldilineaceae bacterium]